MKYLSTALLCVFIGLSVFGVFGMHAFMQDINGGCIAATAQDVDCPKQINSFDYLVFHLNVYQSFSVAVFGENIINIFLFSLIFLLGFIIFFRSPFFRLPKLILSKHRYRFRNSFLLHQKLKITKWLALLENSPSAISRASV